MDITVRVVCKSRVVYFKAKAVEHLSDEHGCSLLAIHADSKGLGSTEKEETVEWSERIASGVDDECHLLIRCENTDLKRKRETVPLQDHLCCK